MGKMMEQAGSMLHIPKDVAAGEPVITITGRRNVYIENNKRIVSFMDDEIKIQGKTCRITVRGKRLAIEYYTGDDILISGLIHSVATEC